MGEIPIPPVIDVPHGLNSSIAARVDLRTVPGKTGAVLQFVIHLEPQTPAQAGVLRAIVDLVQSGVAGTFVTRHDDGAVSIAISTLCRWEADECAV